MILKTNQLEIDLHFNDFVPNDRCMEYKGMFIINTYNGAKLFLNENYAYYQIFKNIGITKGTLNACGEYAIDKIKKDLEACWYLKKMY